MKAKASEPWVVALGISYQRENLLARGLGLEHLKELLTRLVRGLLRHGASFAYGGHWRNEEDNFTLELLRLLSAEVADLSVSARESETGGGMPLGVLYNHSAWPNYLEITPGIEARWVHCCRIVRIDQGHGGFSGKEWVPDAEVASSSSRVLLHEAVTTGAMRRLMLDRRLIEVPGVVEPEVIPGVVARVVMGGRVAGYKGFLPGIFEEALANLERRVPLFILGGFGGAAGVLARVLLGKPRKRPPELTEEWHLQETPGLKVLKEFAGSVTLPRTVQVTRPSLDALWAQIERVRDVGLAKGLGTGLNEQETRELLSTQHLATVVRLLCKGLSRLRNSGVHG